MGHEAQQAQGSKRERESTEIEPMTSKSDFFLFGHGRCINGHSANSAYFYVVVFFVCVCMCMCVWGGGVTGRHQHISMEIEKLILWSASLL